MAPIARFKNSASERELERMWGNGVFANKITAKEAYELSPIFQNEMSYEKFKYRFYNWSRKKQADEEKERTGGMGPPQGTLMVFVLHTH